MDVDAEKAWFVVELESTPFSALASVRLRGFAGFNLGANLGLRLEKRGGFGVVNVVGDLRELLLADRAPPGAWLSTSIFATGSSTTLILGIIYATPKFQLKGNRFIFLFFFNNKNFINLKNK